MEKLNILQKFCTKIARFLQKKFDGDEEDYEIYNYKLQIYFSLLFQFSLIMIISLILNSFIECLIFNFIFITLKRNSGGYHMDSLNKCMISGIIISVIFIFLSHLLLFLIFL
jgi:accessory gene regulator B